MLSLFTKCISLVIRFIDKIKNSIVYGKIDLMSEILDRYEK